MKSEKIFAENFRALREKGYLLEKTWKTNQIINKEKEKRERKRKRKTSKGKGSSKPKKK